MEGGAEIAYLGGDSAGSPKTTTRAKTGRIAVNGGRLGEWGAEGYSVGASCELPGIDVYVKYLSKIFLGFVCLLTYLS